MHIIKKHWNLKYIKNKFNLFLFKKFNPLAPWLTEDAIRFLEAWLLKSDIGFEWGSGRSTIWFAKRIKYLVSVEHNIQWFEKVNSLIKENNLSNIDYNYFPIEKKEEDYINYINNYDDYYFDYILIDGRIRDKCAVLSLKKVKKGGLIIIDNAERYLPNDFSIPQSIGNNYKNQLWETFYLKIKDKRKYWTSNGIWATMIVFM